jgi:hypothetical protein
MKDGTRTPIATKSTSVIYEPTENDGVTTSSG